MTLKLSDERVLELAARTFTVQTLALLSPHKLALLAVERQAAQETINAVLATNEVREMYRDSRRNLRAVHIVSSRLATRHAAMEFSVFGVPVPTTRSKNPPLDYLNQASADLLRSLRDPNLSHEEKARRAGLAATVVANRAYTDTQLRMYRDVMEADPTIRLRKVWVTNTTASSPPCAFCLRLHGKAVDVDEPFPVPKGATPYVDLLGPPIHPNCRCRVMAKLVKT